MWVGSVLYFSSYPWPGEAWAFCSSMLGHGRSSMWRPCVVHLAKNTCQLFSAVVKLLPNNMVYRASFCGPVLDVSILHLSLGPACSTFTILQQSMCLNVSVSNRTTWHEATLQHREGERRGEERESRKRFSYVRQRSIKGDTHILFAFDSSSRLEKIKLIDMILTHCWNAGNLEGISHYIHRIRSTSIDFKGLCCTLRSEANVQCLDPAMNSIMVNKCYVLRLSVS